MYWKWNKIFRRQYKIYDSEIFNNDSGIHLHGETINFKLKNLNIYNNKNGIVIGKLYNQKKYTLENIKCHHNKGDGIGVGGCSSKGIVVVTGDKTDISYNGLDKNRYSAGISTTYDGIVWVLDLDKSISNNNYNSQNYLERFSSKILFKSS